MTTPFPFETRVPIRFRDLDALGHVNHAVYFTYMEVARFDFIRRFLNVSNAMDTPLILGEASCRYVSEALFGETLSIGLGVARFGNKSFEIVYRIEGEDGRLVATGSSTMIMYDYAARRSIPIPPAFREQVLSAQSGWQHPEP